jgi:hypothetical protein
MTLRRGWVVFDVDEQPPYFMRFRSSNAGFLVILLGLAVPLVPVWYVDIAHHSAIVLGFGAACLVALPFVYVETCELNKATGHCLLRRTGVLRARTISFPLSEITRVNIKIRDFGGGYRTGNPYALRLTVTRTSGEEVTLTGWRSSLNVQRRGFAIGEFLGVPFDTTS